MASRTSIRLKSPEITAEDAEDAESAEIFVLFSLCVCAGHGIRPKEAAREVANTPTKAGNRKAKADREATRRCESSGGPVAGTPSQWQRRRREASVGRKSEAKPWSEEYETPTRQPQ